MNRPQPPSDFPLFQGEGEIWQSLDESTKKRVVDSLGLLLLRHFQQDACGSTEELSDLKGDSL